jgi:hypothetical protein
LCATAIETLSIAAMCVYNADLSSFESIAEPQPQLHPASLRLSAQHTCHGNPNSNAHRDGNGYTYSNFNT